MACDAVVELEGASQMEVTKVRSGVRRLQGARPEAAAEQKGSERAPCFPAKPSLA